MSMYTPTCIMNKNQKCREIYCTGMIVDTIYAPIFTTTQVIMMVMIVVNDGDDDGGEVNADGYGIVIMAVLMTMTSPVSQVVNSYKKNRQPRYQPLKCELKSFCQMADSQ